MRYYHGFYWTRFGGRGPEAGFRDFYQALAWLWGTDQIAPDYQVD